MTLTNYCKRIRTSETGFTSSHIIGETTEIKMDEIKEDTDINRDRC